MIGSLPREAIKMITSPKNPKIKYLKSLLQKKNRDKEGKCFLEGEHLIREAAAAGLLADFYYIEETPFVRKLKQPGAQISPKVLSAVSTTEEPQGVIGVAKKRRDSLGGALKRESLLLVVADRIQDPGNIGAIIRTASAVSASAVLLSDECADPYNPKVLRASAGAVFHLPVINIGKTDRILEKLKGQGIKTIAADQKAARNYAGIRYNKRTALVFGNEGQGLSKSVLERCDEKISIPILGKLDSLNVAVSAGIILYEAAKQR